MIEQALITNFQSHKRSLLKFSKGVNVIVGQSDKGKTAVIRAIRWVAHNKPTGDSIRSNWGGDTSVTLQIDGKEIRRTKATGKNTYEIDDLQLKAFGQGVPQEVVQLVNFEEVNLQQQMDAPFLISKTSGEVATFFNKIANIDVIDRATANAKSAIAQTTSTIKHNESSIKQKQSDLEKYNNLEEIGKRLQELQTVDGKRLRLVQSKNSIHVALARIKQIDEELAEIKELVEDEQLINDLLEKRKTLEEKNKQLRKLQFAVRQVKELDKDLAEIAKLQKSEGQVNTLVAAITKLKAKRTDFMRLQALLRNFNTLGSKIKTCAENEAKLVELLPDVCPVCNGTGKLK